MRRREFLKLCQAATPVAAVAATLGCRSTQYAHILKPDNMDLVGSHQAGSAVWNPLVDESVAKLLSRCPTVHPVGFQSATGQNMPPLPAGPAAVCFIGIENKSVEEMVDFKDQLYERIDSQINGNASFRSVSRRMVDAAAQVETRLRSNHCSFHRTVSCSPLPLAEWVPRSITCCTRASQRERPNGTRQRSVIIC